MEQRPRVEGEERGLSDQGCRGRCHSGRRGVRKKADGFDDVFLNDLPLTCKDGQISFDRKSASTLISNPQRYTKTKKRRAFSGDQSTFPLNITSAPSSHNNRPRIIPTASRTALLLLAQRHNPLRLRAAHTLTRESLEQHTRSQRALYEYDVKTRDFNEPRPRLRRAMRSINENGYFQLLTPSGHAPNANAVIKF